MNAVIIYDDSVIAAQAHAMLIRAARRTAEALSWNVKPWKFDMLRLPRTADAPFEDAAAAHLLVLAVRSQASLPARLLNWLEQWAHHRQVKDAALAVFDGAGDGDTLSPATTPTLSQFAERHGLSFIFGDVSPHRDESAVFRDDLHEREVAQTPTMVRILEQSPHDYFRGWGTND